jgi:hypothetical protein
MDLWLGRKLFVPLEERERVCHLLMKRETSFGPLLRIFVDNMKLTVQQAYVELGISVRYGRKLQETWEALCPSLLFAWQTHDSRLDLN